MLLTSPEQVLRLMGAKQLGDNLESAEAALEVTTISLSNALDTPLEKATRRDYFSYSPSVYNTRYVIQTLILKQAFLTDAPAVYVSDGTYIPDDFSIAWVLNTDYLYDPEMGTVKLIRQPPAGPSQIMVEYTAGFTGEDDISLPHWMLQAALREAISQVQSSVIGYNRKNMRDNSGFLDRSARRLLDDHYRPRIGVHPDTSTVLA